LRKGAMPEVELLTVQAARERRYWLPSVEKKRHVAAEVRVTNSKLTSWRPSPSWRSSSTCSTVEHDKRPRGAGS